MLIFEMALVLVSHTSWLVRLSICLYVRCCGHSNLVISNQISSKFHIWIASTKLWFKFEYVFFQRTIIKMADKMAASFQFKSIRCCGHSNLAIFNWISNKFHIWIAAIKLWFKFKYGPRQRAGGTLLFSARPSICLSVRCCGHSDLVISYQFPSKFHIWIFPSNSGLHLNMEFFRRTIIKMADKMAAAYQLHPYAVVDTLT